MISVLASSIIAFFTAIIVAILSHIFSVKRQRKNELAQFRLKAYTDFINATARLAAARRIGITENEIHDLAELNDAKARICICGEKQVIEALIKFWKHGGTLEKEHELQAFKSFCFSVRKSIGMNWKEIAMLEISDALFKLEPSDFSFKKEYKN